MDETNPVKEAIRRFGGMTAATAATNISQSSWVRYRQAGRISDAIRCLMVAKLTGLEPEVLAGVWPMSETPPEPPTAAGPTADTGKAGRRLRRVPPRRRSADEPRVYGTIRKRNNCPLLMLAA